jgi:IPT/TIG domain/Glucodextranase, domain B
MQYRRLHFALLLVLSWALTQTGVAQTATYHLHKEASTITATSNKLLTAGPDAASLATTATLTSKAAGEYLIKEFETQANDPNSAGVIPSGSTFTFNLFMRKTANVGTVLPRAKIGLNGATGPLLCTATGTSALTTTVTKQAISCTTTANIAMTATDRFYLWVGVNLTATSTTAFNGELDIEGTLNGNFDSTIVSTLGTLAPIIASLTPSTGAVKTSVVIAGANFRTPQGNSTLTFNGIASTPTAWTATSITAPVPTGATSGPVVVTVGGQASAGATFTVTPSPSITTLAPNTGAIGSVVTITGANFGPAQGNGTVKFGTTTATVTNWSPTSIVVAVPTGAATGSVVVTAAGGVASNGVTFTVTAAPSITSVTPAAGAASGASFTIAGSNFGATQGNGGVTLNTIPATITSWSATSIVAKVPAGVTTGNVVVTAAGGISSAGVRLKVLNPGGVAIDQMIFADGTATATTRATSAFSTTATNELLLAFISSGRSTGTNPVVNTVTGGSLTWVLVQRTNTQLGTAEIWRAFAPAVLTNATVTATFSQSILSSMTVVSFTGVDTTGTSGAGAIGAVATANAATGAPTATLITTRANSVVFGVGEDPTTKTARTLGSNQSLVHQLLCGAANQTCTLWVQQVPALIPAIGTSVTVNDSAPTADAYNLSLVEIRPVATVAAPAITSLTPTTGPAGSSVTIAGSNFGATQGTSTVTFGGAAATVTSWSATSITAAVPGSVALGAVPVVVTVPGAGTSNSLTFTVVAPLAVSAAISPLPNANNWNNTNVTVSYVCSGGVAPIQCPGPATIITEGANQIVTGTAADANGNHASVSVTLNIDKTIPGITATVTPAAVNGVVTLPATVAFTCTDALSGTASCPVSIPVTTVGANQTFSGAATDRAGNTASTSLRFSVQQAPLAITATAAPAANANNWNNTDVTITYSCSGGVAPVQCAPVKTVTLEGANQIIAASATDAASQTANAGTTLNIDKTAPTITASVSPVAGANGIVTAPAVITFTCTDGLSGITTCPSPITASTAGAGQVFNGSTTDKAGNTASASVTLSVQLTPLAIVASASPAPNAAGWNNSSVTVSFQCTGGVPPLQCPAAQLVSIEGPGQPVSAMVTDASGQTANTSISIKLDKTPPLVTAAVSPAPDANGLVTAASATVTFTCTDNLSGVAFCPPPDTVTAVGLQTISGNAIDIAGNTATGSVQFTLQPFPPLKVIASASPAPNAAGWNNSPVTVSFQCTGGAQPVSCPTSQIVSTDGANQVISGTATDAAGNSASASATVSLDQAPPLVSITSPADATVTTSTNVSVTGSTSDALSGLASVTCNGNPATISGGTFNCSFQITQGSLSISVVATDAAGNSATSSVGVSLQGPKLAITTPASLALFASSAVTVTGTVDDPTAVVTVNGVSAANSGGIFTASGVILREGNNSITATGTNAGGAASTASVNVILDTTPPTVRIDSPSDQAILTTPQIYVTGLVNDVVSGTVNAGQVKVTINGVQATVGNRSFMAEDVLLVPGKNVLTAIATDRAGNVNQSQITVTLQDVGTQQRLLLVSGNAQSGAVGSTLGQPLIVQAINALGQPMVGVPVTFAMNKSDGQLTAFPQQGRQIIVQTDANGQASVSMQLGSRVGNGNNQVLVGAPGFTGQIMFCETSTVGTPAQIHVVSGESQTGAPAQPLPESFVAIVVDNGGNPVAGVPVTFKVEQGGGQIEGGATTTKISDDDGRVAAVLSLAQQEGINNNVVSASFDGFTGAPASFFASGITPKNPASTTVTGLVLDNANQPIPNATASIKDTNLSALTDANGRFSIPAAPVGAVVLFVDGSTSTRPEVFPFLEFPMVTVAGQDNHLNSAIFLPPLDMDNSQIVGGDEDVVLTLKGNPGVAYTIFAHSATFPDGSKTGRLTLSAVHADKVPMSLPNGTTPAIVGTLQPARVKFDPPIRIQVPNSGALLPGQVAEVFSFDHDLEQFVSGGTARVSEDGSVIVSDKGFGLRVSGWHAVPPPPPPPTCVNGCSTKDPCKTSSCVNGACVSKPANEGARCDDGSNQCGQAVCKAGACVPNTNTDGQACDPKDKCVKDPKCQSGSCKGTPVDTTTWKDNASVAGDAKVPADLLNPINSLLSSVGINVAFTEARVGVKGRTKDCCNKDTGIQTDGVKEGSAQVTLTANINNLSLPALSLPTLSREFDFGVAIVSVDFQVGVSLTTSLRINGEAGVRSDACQNQNCGFGEVNASLDPELALKVEAIACLETLWTTKACGGLSITPASLRLSLRVGASFNKPDCNAGFKGVISLGRLVFRAVFQLDVPGSPRRLVFEYQLYGGSSAGL